MIESYCAFILGFPISGFPRTTSPLASIHAKCPSVALKQCEVTILSGKFVIVVSLFANDNNKYMISFLPPSTRYESKAIKASFSDTNLFLKFPKVIGNEEKIVLEGNVQKRLILRINY